MPKRDDTYMAARRAEILAAANAIIIRDGMQSLSTTALCKEAGISMGALYTHFATKDDIVMAVAEGASDRRKAQLGTSGGDVFDDLRAMARVMNTPEGRQLGRVDIELFNAAAGDPRIAAFVKQARIGRDVQAALESLKAEGKVSVDNLPAVTLAIEAALIGLSVLSQASPDQGPSASEAMGVLLKRMLA
jgi:AcrR family transcriptional regulator